MGSPLRIYHPTFCGWFNKMESGMRCVGTSQKKFFENISEIKVEWPMYRKKLFRMLSFTTYLNFVKIGEVYPFMHNCRNIMPFNHLALFLISDQWLRCYKSHRFG